MKKVKHYRNEKSEIIIQKHKIKGMTFWFAFLVFFYPYLLAGFISIIVAFTYVVHKTPQEFMGYCKEPGKRDPLIVSLLLKELDLLASPTELSCLSENRWYYSSAVL